MHIGKIHIDFPVLPAPMAGFTDSAFRILARRFGCGLVFTEMISAEGLARKDSGTLRYLGFDPAERPVGVQLFGSNPEVMARSAVMARETGADLIDVNLGCPVRKVTKNGAGAALLTDLDKLEAILLAIRRRVDCPLTVKMRAGWDCTRLNYLEVGRIAEGSGVDAVTLHARTARQLFRGRADWDLIRRLKETLRIPVFGNGDVRSPSEAADMLARTGCDGVMVGRWASGNPWVFEQIRDHASGLPPRTPGPRERREVIRFHFDRLQERFDTRYALRKMRGHIMYYTKSLPFGSEFRRKVSAVKSETALFAILDDYFDRLEAREHEGKTG